MNNFNAPKTQKPDDDEPMALVHAQALELAKELEVIQPLPDEDFILAYTHHHRKVMVKDMVKQGLPQDPRDRMVLLATLKDMDGSALTRKRIKADSENGASAQGAAKQIIAEILMGTSNLSTQRVSDGMVVSRRLSADIPPPVLVEGETAAVAPHQTYDTFVAKFSRPETDTK